MHHANDGRPEACTRAARLGYDSPQKRVSTALAKIARRVIDEPIEETIGRLVLRHERHMAALEKLYKKSEGRTALMCIVQMERLANEHCELLMSMGVLTRAAQLHTV